MLLWLVERLPKTGDEATEDILGPNALLNRSIAERLTSWTGDAWALHACERHCASGLTTPRYSRNHLATCPLIVATPVVAIASVPMVTISILVLNV